MRRDGVAGSLETPTERDTHVPGNRDNGESYARGGCREAVDHTPADQGSEDGTGDDIRGEVPVCHHLGDPHDGGRTVGGDAERRLPRVRGDRRSEGKGSRGLSRRKRVVAARGAEGREVVRPLVRLGGRPTDND